MNNPVFKNSIRFVVLVLLQVLLFNQINLLGYINPYVYLLFIILYPIKENRTAFIFISFLLGLCVDVFTDSGGIHAASCATVAYIRPTVLRFSFGINYEFQAAHLLNTPLAQRITYIGILILTHNLVLFSLDFFSFTHILSILNRTLLSGGFTLILCLVIIPLFSFKK